MTELAIGNRLADTAGVTALVGGRIYQLALPQSADTPAVRLQLISEPKDYHLRGPNNLVRARVQVDAYVSEEPRTETADPYMDLTALAAAIDLALSGKTFVVDVVDEERAITVTLRITGGFRQNKQVSRETAQQGSQELRLLRSMQDYTVWAKREA